MSLPDNTESYQLLIEFYGEQLKNMESRKAPEVAVYKLSNMIEGLLGSGAQNSEEMTLASLRFMRIRMDAAGIDTSIAMQAIQRLKQRNPAIVSKHLEKEVEKLIDETPPHSPLPTGPRAIALHYADATLGARHPSTRLDWKGKLRDMRARATYCMDGLRGLTKDVEERHHNGGMV